MIDMYQRMKGMPLQTINFMHIYLYNVLITATVLGALNITASNGAIIVVTVGIISGVGIRVLDEHNKVLTSGYLSIKQALWFALIAPFQIYKIQLW